MAAVAHDAPPLSSAPIDLSLIRAPPLVEAQFRSSTTSLVVDRPPTTVKLVDASGL